MQIDDFFCAVTLTGSSALDPLMVPSVKHAMVWAYYCVVFFNLLLKVIFKTVH